MARQGRGFDPRTDHHLLLLVWGKKTLINIDRSGGREGVVVMLQDFVPKANQHDGVDILLFLERT